MKLHTLKKSQSRSKSKKRVGRGYGSGLGGHVTGRGMKGQKSRSGGKIKLGFEGGQVPLYRALPQYRGFKPREGKAVPVNLNQLEKKFSSGDVVTLKRLIAAGLLRKKQKSAKILGQGDLKKKLVIKGIAVSKTAEEKILKAGGKINGK